MPGVFRDSLMRRVENDFNPCMISPNVWRLVIGSTGVELIVGTIVVGAIGLVASEGMKIRSFVFFFRSEKQQPVQ